MNEIIDGFNAMPCGPRHAARRVAAWRLWIPGALLALGLQVPATSRAAGCALRTVELPVHLVGQRAIATVRIDGQDVPMIVDSGAFYSGLTDAAATQLHLYARHAPGLRVEGITGPMQARVTTANLELLKGIVPNVEFIVGGNDPGAGALGMLGRNVLSFTDTEYDLAHGVIRFAFPSDGCADANMAYWAGSTPVSELELKDDPSSRTPAIRASAKLDGMPLDVLFDTGATTLVSLRAAKRAGVKAQDMKAAGRIHGVGQGSAQAWTASFARFELGGEAVLNNHLGVADFDLDDADMLLGIDFFLSHRIYVSKQQSRMFFTYAGGPVFARNVEAPASAAASGAPNGQADPALDADGYARRGEASRARGDLQGALADLDRACVLAPRSGAFFEARARVRLALAQTAQALDDLDTALALDPQLGTARLERAELRADQGHRDGALEDLAALDKSLAPQAQSRQAMARLYGRLDQPARAVAQWDLWIPAHLHESRLESAYNNRCWMRMLLGTELDKALADCDQAVGLDPGNASYVDSRAWVYLRMGRWQQARSEFDRGLAIRPDGATSLYGRGIVRLHLGDTAAGQADLAAARKLQPAIDADMKRQGLAQEQVAGG